MELSHLFTAFLLLAGALIVAGAGIQALDSAYSDTRDRVDDPNTTPTETTDELEVGLDLSSTLAYLLPLFGWIGVPLGIIGLLVAVGWRSVASNPGGVGR